MKPLIELGDLLDLIDDNNWGEYSCAYSTDGGKHWHDGVIQSDGYTFAPETLQDENGNDVT